MITNKYSSETKEKRNIAIYSRKSKFTGKGESIENQIDLCLKYIKTYLLQPEDDDFTSSQYTNRLSRCAESQDPDHSDRYAADRDSGPADSCNFNQTDIHNSDHSVIRVYEDEGFSGSTLNRPQFIKMMAAAEKGEISAIVVYRLDRISRNTADFASLITRLDHLNIDFISIKERFDTSTPMGRAMMYMSSVFSQLERETIAERIRDNMHELARTGRWLGGTTPTGFASQPCIYTDAQGKSRKACRLAPVPHQLAVVSEIYETFLSTASLSRTEALLSAAGLRSKTGRPYTRYSIKTILTNPVYAAADRNTLHYLQSIGVHIASPAGCFDGRHGLMVYNKTHQQPGRANKKKPPSQWIAAVGQHPAVINGAEWSAVQQIFDSNKKHRVSSFENCGSDSLSFDIDLSNLCEYSK